MPKKYTRPIIVSALVGLSAILLMISYVNSDTSAEQANNTSVTSVTPSPGGLHNPRGDIIVDLEPGLAARLEINSTVIPDDQIISVESESLYTFRPAEDNVIEEFEAGANQAVVVFWPQGQTEPADAQRYSWEFRVAP